MDGTVRVCGYIMYTTLLCSDEYEEWRKRGCFGACDRLGSKNKRRLARSKKRCKQQATNDASKSDPNRNTEARSASRPKAVVKKLWTTPLHSFDCPTGGSTLMRRHTERILEEKPSCDRLLGTHDRTTKDSPFPPSLLLA